jgi:enoyl-CoA hydratase/carnithine racemase
VLLDWNQRVLQSRDAAEGVSAFLKHRPPVFEGR